MGNKLATIEEYEGILSKLNSDGKPYWCVRSEDANCTMFEAYCSSKEAGNMRVDFNEVIWDADIKPIADTMRRFGIKEFTISVHQGNLIDVLAAFQELGVFIKGMVQVKTRYHNVVSAILMQIA